ncbi:hypothetical protein [Streptomyces sp. NPDC056244]|uniref:hypothetical protein n=1 Tax=Streptomyces sp. NPDC056244 TaxID=3345762 RepID=UPI0035E1F495
MAFTDHHDVFIGSTDDGYTFAVINYPLPAAHSILTQSGFTAVEHRGRTIYLLPPRATTAEEYDSAEQALHLLHAFSMDVADLRSTGPWHGSEPAAEPAARVAFSGRHVTATATTDDARTMLDLHGFQATPEGYALPDGMGERESVNAVLGCDIHLWTLGLACTISLNIPTPDAIPPAPGRIPAPPYPAPHQPPRRRGGGR